MEFLLELGSTVMVCTRHLNPVELVQNGWYRSTRMPKGFSFALGFSQRTFGLPHYTPFGSSLPNFHSPSTFGIV